MQFRCKRSKNNPTIIKTKILYEKKYIRIIKIKVKIAKMLYLKKRTYSMINYKIDNYKYIHIVFNNIIIILESSDYRSTYPKRIKQRIKREFAYLCELR